MSCVVILLLIQFSLAKCKAKVCFFSVGTGKGSKKLAALLLICLTERLLHDFLASDDVDSLGQLTIGQPTPSPSRREGKQLAALEVVGGLTTDHWPLTIDH